MCLQDGTASLALKECYVVVKEGILAPSLQNLMGLLSRQVQVKG